jgi:NitT/TauT family transport system substrate-binding protein
VIANSWVGFAPIYVAEDMGYYKKLGINVTMTVDESKSDALAALERGDVTVGMMTVDDMQRAPWANGDSGEIIGTVDESLGGDGVVADGSIHSVTDLKGKIVATAVNLPATMLLKLELAKHGMSLKDLDIRQIDGGDAISVFSDHSVAAVGAYQPYISTILKVDAARNPHVLVSSAQYPGYIVDVAVVMKKNAEAEPAALKSFLAGIYQAVALYQSNPTKFVALAAPHFNLTPAAFQATVSSSLNYTTLAKAQSYMGSPGKPGQMFKAFDAIEQLNLNTGAMKTKMPATTAIDNSIIAGIAPVGG